MSGTDRSGHAAQDEAPGTPGGPRVAGVSVLVTGMSGTGKSTVLRLLARRGHRVVDTDDDGWCTWVTHPSGEREEVWREDRVRALLDGHTDGLLFVGGCRSNQGRLRDAFAAVVLLSAPEDVMLARVAERSGNPFGKSEQDRARIRADLRDVQPLLRRAATLEVVTTCGEEEVADRVEAAGLARLVRAAGPGSHP